MRGCIRDGKEVGNLTAGRRDHRLKIISTRLRELNDTWNLYYGGPKQRTTFIVSGQYWKANQENK